MNTTKNYQHCLLTMMSTISDKTRSSLLIGEDAAQKSYPKGLHFFIFHKKHRKFSGTQIPHFPENKT